MVITCSLCVVVSSEFRAGEGLPLQNSADGFYAQETEVKMEVRELSHASEAVDDQGRIILIIGIAKLCLKLDGWKPQRPKAYFIRATEEMEKNPRENLQGPS